MKPNTPNRIPAWLVERPIAHRGLHTLPDAPENSLAAFVAAADAGFAIELDVRLLRSGEVVVFHDADWLRMTGHTGVVEESTASDIAPFRLLQTSEPVPLLRDAFPAVAGRVPFLIELKSVASVPVGVLEDAVLQVMEGYPGKYAYQAFRRESVEYLRTHAPADVACGQLAANDNWHISGGAQIQADFLGYLGTALPTPVSAAFRENGGPVLAWTVQSSAQQEQVAPHADNLIFENFIPTK